jgi:hypothetical protein
MIETITAAQYRAQPPQKRRKYRNKHVIVGSQHFDSMREAKRWLVLQGKEQRGEIRHLERQVTYQLAPSVRIAGEKRARPALRFKVDFRYVEKGEIVIEDAKGFSDTAFRIRQHLMKAIHGLDVRLS